MDRPADQHARSPQSPQSPQSSQPPIASATRTRPVQQQPQVVHITAKHGGLSRAVWFVFGLFMFGVVFFCGLIFGGVGGAAMMFGSTTYKPVVLEELYRHSGSQQVAVIPIEGIIQGSSARFVRDCVEQVLHDPSRFKAVVLRVNSPGGGVTASDQIWYEVERLRGAGLPVVASYGGLAASGGYYVSCSSDHIVAEPTCVTGSIGVIAQVFTFEELLDKVGIEPVTLVATDSPDKDTANDLFRSWSEQDRQKIVAMLDAAYDIFRDRVKTGRKSVITDSASLDALTDGSIFTADQALQHGLIDSVGYLDDAIAEAEKRARIAPGKSTVVVLRTKQSLFSSLLGVRQNLGNSAATEIAGNPLDADALRGLANDLGSPRLMYLMQMQ